MKKCVWVAFILILTTGVSVWADDTEIYGTVTNPDLDPNILIIFDSSGSMSTVDVPGDPYDPITVYTGSYSTDAVYERYWSWSTLETWALLTWLLLGFAIHLRLALQPSPAIASGFVILAIQLRTLSDESNIT